MYENQKTLPYPFLVLPRYTSEACVQLQVLSGSKVLEQSVKLRTVTNTLLHT